MRMSFIGAGKVGTALGMYLKKNGFAINGYYSKTYDSAVIASQRTNSRAFHSLEELCIASDMIWITTNDDFIHEVGRQLATLDSISEGTIVAHVSGALSSQILVDLKQKGCLVYSIHPLQAFAQIETALEQLNNTVFTIEGDEEKISFIKEIFVKTNNPHFIIEQEGKALYHAGACVLSNYLVTLVDVAFHLFEQAGMDKNVILDATLPLIMGTLENIRSKDPKEALTGPIQRGDLETIEKHIKVIKDKVPQDLEFYKFMGRKTLDLAKDHKTNEEIEELIRVLEGETT